jgi:YHS domain-containing protein
LEAYDAGGHPAQKESQMSEIHDQVTDPVCGMTIRREDAIYVIHDGSMYHFCEAVCADTFRDDPPRWAEGFEHRAHVIDPGAASHYHRTSVSG